MKKILIINQGLSANLGDKAILKVLENYFKEKGYSVTVTGYTHFKNTEINKIDYEKYTQTRKFDLPVYLKWFLKFKRKMKKEMKKYIDNYDFAFIGGGQLIKTNCYFPFAFAEWSKFINKYSKTKVLLGVGVDNHFNIYEKKLYKSNLKKFDYISFRDKRSQEYAKKFFNVSSDLIPDVAFLADKATFNLNTKNKKNTIVGIMPFDFNTYRYHFGNVKTELDYNNFWVDLIRKKIKDGGSVRLLYTTIEDKKQVNLIFNMLSSLDKEKVSISNCDSLDNFLRELEKITTIYSSRMHALILGMVYGCEINCIKISDKLINFEKEYISTNIDTKDLSHKIDYYLSNILKEKRGD